MAFLSHKNTKYFVLALLGSAAMMSTPVSAQDTMPSPTPITNEGEAPNVEVEVQNLLPDENITAPDQAALNDLAPATPTSSDSNTEPDVDVFYDADVLVPEGELARTAPRKVDPTIEPASKLIIVTKNASAGSRHAQLVSASRAIKLGRYSSALEIYNELYRKNKRDPNILMGRAVALQKLGLVEEAIFAYEELLEIRPKNTEARINMLGLISDQFPSVALRQLKDLRKQNPDNVGLVAQMAITEARIGNFDSAMRYMGVAASMEPNNANHFFNLAIIADQAGARKDAVKYYEQALEIDTIYGGSRSVPRDQIYSRLAQIR